MRLPRAAEELNFDGVDSQTGGLRRGVLDDAALCEDGDRPLEDRGELHDLANGGEVRIDGLARLGRTDHDDVAFFIEHEAAGKCFGVEVYDLCVRIHDRIVRLPGRRPHRENHLTAAGSTPRENQVGLRGLYIALTLALGGLE